MPDVVPITAGSGVGVDTDEVTFNLTGTVAKTNASATVTGTGSTFTTQLVSGDVIRIPGGTSTEDRTVLTIASDTSLTVTVAFTTTASGQTGQRVAHRQVMQQGVAGTAAATNVTGAAADTQLVAANTGRIGLILFNDSTAIAYVKYGTGASATSYTVPMGPGAYWEMPAPVYTGQVNALWSAANGAMRITELTP
jgi:hypothetical protein